jgi:hypothetical protein
VADELNPQPSSVEETDPEGFESEILLPPKPNGGGAPFGLIIGIVLVVVFAGAGFFLGSFNKTRLITPLQNEIAELETTNTSLDTQIEELKTANADLQKGIIMVPYTNSENSYIFKYPSQLNLIDYSDNSSRTNIIALELNKKTILTVKAGRKEQPEEEHRGVAATETLTIDGHAATKHVFSNGIVNQGQRTDPFVAYKVIAGTTQYVLEFYGSTKLSDYQNRVFKSFDLTTVVPDGESLFFF